MDDFFDKFKKSAVKAKDEAEKLTKNVIKKSSGLVEQTKISFSIGETESKIEDVFCEIGKYVYEKYKEGSEFTDEVGEKCRQIDSMYEDVEALKQQLATAKESVICKGCGEYNKVGSAFCSKCGVKLEDE